MLNAGVLQGLIDANLAADGARGPRRSRFSGCVARGVVTHFVGKAFTTTDTGNGKGGSGFGTGIQALSSSNMTDIAYGVASARGPKARSFFSAIMRAIEEHLRSATQLTTTDPDVGKGVGKVNVGSYAVDIGGLQGLIQSELQADGANGPKLSNLALAIATGVVQDVKATGTGTTTINGPVIPPGTSGTGYGTIS